MSRRGDQQLKVLERCDRASNELNIMAGAPENGNTPDGDEIELMRLAREHPELFCETCNRPHWHPKLNEALDQLVARLTEAATAAGKEQA